MDSKNDGRQRKERTGKERQKLLHWLGAFNTS
jgi:hypothetical protein